ncbi:methionine ABC transporter ATP-binding protein [Pleomorphomonas carboxyditropha]|uniref:Cell division ATP-binding protein FtsE n=1 Tax=Pleomorphomonas carboxyditropha TaxID=2023338 RepID=A0A2G9WUD4_9HYPH|nr:methionine ABC transporter ATP-binding protein [Pleomorphomonas carboxyditropha]PIO97922.1 methionine ABC transporter ATP-binding protein [Pleomorphomonas carboxyditropha]
MNALPQSADFAPPEAAAKAPAIRLERLGKTFDPAVGPVLDDISLTVGQGDIYGIIGRSGAGKSTLVRCINRLERPTTGRVLVADRDITALAGAELRSARRDIGMIFQHFNLLSSRTVAGNVALPLEVAGLSRAEIAGRIPPLLDLVGLADKAASYPSELSGGQKQRVGIARALATNPSVLLCDEATSALDPETTEQILSLLRDINRRLGLTIVLITHEMQVVRDIASHVAVLERGRLIEEGVTFDVLAFPKSAVARSFLSGLVAHELPPPVERRLRAAPGPDTDPVLRIVFSGDYAHQPVIADLIHRFPVEPNILFGRIDYVGDRPLGVLTLALGNGEAHLSAIVGHLAALGLHAEVIGHVSRLP